MPVKGFGESVGNGSYDPVCDFNHDGSVDVIDLPTLNLVYDFKSQDRRIPLALRR